MGAATSFRKPLTPTKISPSASEASSLQSQLENSRSTRRLDLTSQSYTSFPDQLSKATHLNTLILNDNQLLEIDPSMFNLKTLGEVQIRCNKINTLPRQISSLTNLSSISLSSNNITEIPSDIGGNSQLEEIVLWGNKVSSLPVEIGRLSKLHLLDLSNNRLSTLPASVGKLQSLTELKVGHNLISSLPIEIGQLSSLIFLDISSNRLNEIPAELWNCQSLARLNAKRNHISQIPLPAANLLYLSEVNFEKNKLTSMGDLSFFPKVKKLVLTQNEISTIPDSLTNLSQINMLLLENNPISFIPSFVFSIPSLGMLYLSGHAVSNIPEDFSTAKSLSVVHLRSGILQSFPKYFCGKMEKLYKLDLSNNLISKLPQDFSGLCCLHELKLSENKIETIPESISDLTSLQILNLHSNHISSLPVSIGRLSKIKKLFLSYNKISRIPTSMGDLSSLHELHLSANPLEALPQEMTHLKALKSLWMASTFIKMQDVESILSELSGLTSIDLSRNDFSEVPNFIWSSPNQLLHVNLSSNKIQELPKKPLLNQKISSFDLTNNPLPVDAIKLGGNLMTSNDANFRSLEQLAMLPNSLCVKASFVSCIGRRAYMEDFLSVSANLGNGFSYFAIFDGHDGSETANFLKHKFPAILERNLKKLEPVEALKRAYDDAHYALRSLSIGTSGSTALTILMDRDYIYCANAGDSRATLFQDEQFTRISVDHKPFVSSEFSRIRELGGFVSDEGRVSGILSMSRAFGDLYLHPFVTWEPSVSKIARSSADKWLVMASDGLWDTVPEKTAAQVLQTCTESREAAHKLRDRAFLNESGDNTTIMVIEFTTVDDIQLGR